MNTKKVLAAVSLAFALAATGCSAHDTASASQTETPKTSTAAKHSKNASTDTPTISAAPTQSASDTATTSTELHSVHSPGVVADDIKLTPGQCHVKVVDAASGKYLPDSSCTPGAFDPAVTQDNISSTICKSGYTATVRPPASETGKFKNQSLADYGLTSEKTTEYDHLVSLELGGTNAVSNLWVEPNRSGATGTTNPKDAVETNLNKAVCAHKVKLADAQKAIVANWTTAESVLGL